MLYNLLYPLKDSISIFNIFRYITFRAVMAAFTTFLFSVIFGNFVIGALKKLNIKEKTNRKYCSALNDIQGCKEGTPTMGGLLIVFSVVVSTLLWANLLNKYVILTLFAFLGLGVVGFLDDYIKLREKNSHGLSITAKFAGQLIIGVSVAVILFFDKNISSQLYFPFFKNLVINLGILYIPFVVLVICGSSNAVNFTDGLDGLAIGCTIMTAFTFSVLCYVAGHAQFSQYLFIPFIPHAGELTIFCAAIAGACMGFLWFNCFPAGVFMGDVGSLAIGGAMGLVAILIKKEILLVIVGGVFVIEALSVIIQIASFKLRGKRIFKMAPLHHHFQMLGIPESKIIVRFWIISALLAFFALLTLKIR
ncbi:phospho-N-acetylmuramoyl-pentapeptide-transferase [Thermoproteota archaeon]